MMLALVGNPSPRTKPGDLIRTSDGATGTVIEILPGGYRLVRLLNHSTVRVHVSALYLVRSSLPRPWPSYRE